MKSQLVQLYENAPAGTYPTDKHNEDHRTFGRSYLDFYGELLDPIRHELRGIVEIGVRFGGSLWLWKDYAPQATVVGIDIDPLAKNAEKSRDVTVLTGSQDDDRILMSAMRLLVPRDSKEPELDLVVDDGSHVVRHIIHSFNELWPFVRSGGYYVIEDIRCVYHDPDMGWPGMSYNDGTFYNQGCQFEEFVMLMMRQMHHQNDDAERIIIAPMMMAILKA